MPAVKTENIRIFEDYSVPKALAAMAVPTVMSQLIVLLYNLADTFYIGRTNDPCMVAGATLILPVFNISLAIACLSGVGGGSLVSRLLGMGRHQEARKVSAFAIFLGIGIAAFFSVSLGMFMKPFLSFIGAGELVLPYASQYAFWVMVVGGVPTVLSNVLSGLIRSTGYSRKASFGIMMGGVLNIILDPIFMFKLFPEGMEIYAAGAATCLSNVISALYFIVTIAIISRETRRQNPDGPEFAVTFRIDEGLPGSGSIKALFNVGIPTALSTLLFDIDYMFINRLMSAYSDAALAAVGIVLKAERLPLNIGIGICQGMTPLAAYNYSSGNHKRMKDVAVTAGVTGIICAAVSVALYLSFAPQIMRIFINEAETVRLGTIFLRFRSLATPFMFLSFFPLHLFNAFGEGKYAMLLGIVRWCVFNIPMLLILDRIFGMNGIVLSQVSADVMNVIFSFIVLVRYIRKTKWNI